MAENSDAGASDNDKESAKPRESEASAMNANLPMVVAPKLGAGEDEVTEDAVAEDAAPPATPVHNTRFLMLAASVAFAAFGSFVGSVSGSGMANYLYPAAPVSGVANTTDAMRELKLELADLSMIKADLDNTSRSATSQFAKLADRLDRLDAHTASADVTGSIAAPPAAATAPAPLAPKFTDRILQDWVVHDVRGGRALVEN